MDGVDAEFDAGALNFTGLALQYAGFYRLRIIVDGYAEVHAVIALQCMSWIGGVGRIGCAMC